MELFWHRRDLRVADNLGLAATADRDAVAPVFVFDGAVLDHAGAPRVRFMLDALAALRDAYRDRESDLLVAHGDPAAVLPALADALDADGSAWNRDYSGLARDRDARVRRALDDVDVGREAHHDAVLHTPDAIRTNQGDPYQVYTYYWKKWQDREKENSRDPPSPDDLVASGDLEDAVADVDVAAVEGVDAVAVGDLPSIEGLGFEAPDATIQPAGTAAARDRLESFCGADVFRYEEGREYPAESGTSRLSADLKFGTIGVREVHERVMDAKATAEAGEFEGDLADLDPETAVESVEEFESQLAWREFYTQVLFHNPEVVTENYQTYEEPIEWENDPDHLAAWKAGETGYPIVDAGMRQLRAEAYMHNRVRMIVASFLTKDLLIDWREGYDHFREHLVDHDTANDNGGWQSIASTGTDAQPYFRIFNPMTQGERYDPDAEYIREFVPELRGVDADLIHEWHELSDTQRRRAAPDYPTPIVDHSERREQALAMFKRARGEDPEE
ncbi:cryptochrome/photolyase family protein [Haloparvum sp. PAK95]|uniref:cryptochrome/photolyase family protein n=1 Tax=Haloparvum sp. PAK95 TaxID=3418962 RepID=UPI003D2EE460